VKTAFPAVPDDLPAAIDLFTDELMSHELIREAPRKLRMRDPTNWS
jgi:hypothetical protein